MQKGMGLVSFALPRITMEWLSSGISFYSERREVWTVAEQDPNHARFEQAMQRSAISKT